MQYFSDEQLNDMFRLLDFDMLQKMGYDLTYDNADELDDLLMAIEEDFSELDREDKIAELRQIGAFDDDYLVSEVKMGAEEAGGYLGNFSGSHDGVDYKVSYNCSHDLNAQDSYYKSEMRNYVEAQISNGYDSGSEPFVLTDERSGKQMKGTVTWESIETLDAETKRQRMKREKEEAAMDEASTDVDYMREHYSESDAYIYAYNDGHTDARGDAGYRPSATERELTSFKKIFKQAESGYLGQGVDAPRGWDNQGNPLDTNRPRGSEHWNYWYGITKDGDKVSGNILVYIINKGNFKEDRKKNNRLAQEKANEIVQKRGLKEITVVDYIMGDGSHKYGDYKDTGFTIVDGNDEETFAADSPFNTLLLIREDIIIDDEEDFDRLLSIYMSLETDIAQLYQETSNPKHPLLGEMMRYRNRIANRLDELQEEVAIQDTIEMDAEQRRLADPTVPIQLEKPLRTGYKLGIGAIAAGLTIPLAILGIGAFYNRE